MATKNARLVARKSSTALSVPVSGNTLVAELLLNIADKKLYSKDASAIFQVAPSMAEHNLKAPISSPEFTDNPTAPTQVTSDSSMKLATTAFVKAVVNALVDAAPGTLDTLKELATALGNDPNFATTITNQIALKAPLSSPEFTGNPTAPTQDAGNDSTRLATTAFVKANSATPTQGAKADAAMQPAMYDPQSKGGDAFPYDTKALAVAATISAEIHSIELRGSAALGDGLGGLYIDTNNGSTDTFTSNGGTRTWYRAADVGINRLDDGLRTVVEMATPLADFNRLGASGLRICLQMRGPLAGRVIQGFTFVPKTGEFYYLTGTGTDWVDRQNTIVRADKEGVVIDYSSEDLLTLGHGQGLNHLYLDGVLTFLSQNEAGNGMTAFTYTNGATQPIANKRNYVLSNAGANKHTTIGLSADKRVVIASYRDEDDDKFYMRFFDVFALLNGSTGDRSSEYFRQICLSDNADYDGESDTSQHQQGVTCDERFAYSLNGYFEIDIAKYLYAFRLSDGLLVRKEVVDSGKAFAATMGTGTTYEPEDLEWVQGALGTKPTLYMGMRTGGSPYNNWAVPLSDTIGALAVNGDRSPLGIGLYLSGGGHDFVRRGGTYVQFDEYDTSVSPPVFNRDGEIDNTGRLVWTKGIGTGSFILTPGTYGSVAGASALGGTLGGIRKIRTAVTASPYNIPADATESEYVYHVLPSVAGTAVAINLPQAALQGQMFYIACGGTGVTTLTGVGGATINGGATKILTVSQLYTVVCTRNNGGSAAQWMTQA